MWRRGEFLGVCHAPPQGSGTPALTNLWVSLPHISYTAEFGRFGSNGNPLSPNYQIFVITDMGRGLFPGGEPRSVPKGQSPSAPSYRGSALSITTLFKEERPWCLFFCLFVCWSRSESGAACVPGVHSSNKHYIAVYCPISTRFPVFFS